MVNTLYIDSDGFFRPYVYLYMKAWRPQAENLCSASVSDNLIQLVLAIDEVYWNYPLQYSHSPFGPAIYLPNHSFIFS